MARKGIRSKTGGDDWEAFHPRYRHLLQWPRGELKRIKTRFWRRLRARLRSRPEEDA
jgi:hypothetical protein